MEVQRSKRNTSEKFVAILAANGCCQTGNACTSESFIKAHLHRLNLTRSEQIFRRNVGLHGRSSDRISTRSNKQTQSATNDSETCEHR